MYFINSAYFFLISSATGQGEKQNDDGSITDPAPVNAFLNILVRSNKNGYLRNLTYKDFEVYIEKELQEIEFFTFDKTKNQYILGFYKENFRGNKWYNVKIKLKLSIEKKKDYGKISVKTQKGYYPSNPKSEI